MKIFASIDFETSNIERNSACAIGYVLFNSNKILKKKSYLIKPPKPEIYFTEIHGITWDMLKNKNNFDKVWAQAIQDLNEADIFFAHNANRRVIFAPPWRLLNLCSVLSRGKHETRPSSAAAMQGVFVCWTCGSGGGSGGGCLACWQWQWWRRGQSG